MRCRDGRRSGRKWTIGPLVALLATLGLASPQTASAADPEVFSFGYTGCDLLVMTEYFELGPGEVFTFMIDQSGCLNRDIGRLGYFGYTTKGWRSRELLVRDGIDLKMLSMDDGLELDYQSLGGYETEGDLERSLIELSGPAFHLFSVENTTRQKKNIRVQVQSGL